jgi:hypothetical protein
VPGHDDHNKRIAAAAKESLAPLGMTRKGRSRIWLDDCGWRLGIVEFQPSQWDRGTYLNVGLMFLWSPQEHLTFEVGYRVDDFKSAADSDFLANAERKAATAAQRIADLRRQFDSLLAVIEYFTGRVRPLILYEEAHVGTAYGLTGDLHRCRAALDRALELREDSRAGTWNATAWLLTARAAAEDSDAFSRWVRETIDATRRALKLPVVSALPTE